MVERWAEGLVDRAGEHFEIRCGDPQKGSWDDWKPVALLGQPKDRVFTVMFLVSNPDPDENVMVRAVKEELDFFLKELHEPDPWKYAQYHCTSASNIYSFVHWSYFRPKEKKQP